MPLLLVLSVNKDYYNNNMQILFIVLSSIAM